MKRLPDIQVKSQKALVEYNLRELANDLDTMFEDDPKALFYIELTLQKWGIYPTINGLAMGKSHSTNY